MGVVGSLRGFSGLVGVAPRLMDSPVRQRLCHLVKIWVLWVFSGLSAEVPFFDRHLCCASSSPSALNTCNSTRQDVVGDCCGGFATNCQNACVGSVYFTGLGAIRLDLSAALWYNDWTPSGRFFLSRNWHTPFVNALIYIIRQVFLVFGYRVDHLIRALRIMGPTSVDFIICFIM